MNEQVRWLNEEGRAEWDRKAEFWDALHGDEGNRFHRRLLTPRGRLVIATAHPAFNSNLPVLIAELEDRDGALVMTPGMKVTRYLDIAHRRAVGAIGEPAPHWFYHRPLHELLGEAFAAGLVLDGLEEPAFGPDDVDPERPLKWSANPQIPPVLAARLRPR